MEDLNDKTLGSNLAAGEWNQVPSELQNIIEQTGQTLTNADVNQLGKGVANYVGNNSFYTDSGGINTYVLTNIGSQQPITEYTEGLTVEFLPANTNLNSSTVNVASLGVKNIVDTSIEGTIEFNRYVTLKFRQSSDDFLITSVDKALVGTITAYATIRVPVGYLECDGSELSRASFPQLFDQIGTIYGFTSGSVFNIPDLRGEFIRGFDNGAGNDPDAGTRTDSGGGPTGDDVGTKQLDEFESHIHDVTSWQLNAFDASGGPNTVGADSAGSGSLQPTQDSNMVLSAGGNETRPRNVYMMYIIKF